MDETHKLPAIWITFRWFQGCRYPPYLLDLWRQTWRGHGSFSAKDTVRKRGGLPVPQSGLTHVVFVDGGFLGSEAGGMEIPKRGRSERGSEKNVDGEWKLVAGKGARHLN